MSVLILVPECADRMLNAMCKIIDQYVTVSMVTQVILTRFVFEVFVSYPGIDLTINSTIAMHLTKLS